MLDVLDLIFRRQNGMPTPTPPGQTPPNRFPQIYGFMGAFLPLATIALTLRLVSRLKFSYIGYDDIAISIAYILFVSLIVATVFATKYGLGIHIWDVDYPRTGVSMQKCGFSSQVLYPASQGFVKFSILLFLSRVVPSTSRWKRRIWAIAAFVVCQETAFTITLFLQCRPTSYYWNKDMKPPGTCINQPVFYYVDASVNISTDLLILSLPWMIFSSLQVPRRKKYALLAICSAGIFTLITSIIRLPFLHDLNQSNDPTWGVVDIATWSIAELGSAITTASIPTTRPLITWLFPKFRLTSTGESHPSDHSQFQSRSRSKSGVGSLIALNTIGGGKIGRSDMKNYSEITDGRGSEGEDNESEEYILAENGRIIRQTLQMSASSESSVKGKKEEV